MSPSSGEHWSAVEWQIEHWNQNYEKFLKIAVIKFQKSGYLSVNWIREGSRFFSRASQSLFQRWRVGGMPKLNSLFQNKCKKPEASCSCVETHQHPGVKRVPALEWKRNTYKSMWSTEVAISNQELKLMFLIGLEFSFLLSVKRMRRCSKQILTQSLGGGKDLKIFFRQWMNTKIIEDSERKGKICPPTLSSLFFNIDIH